MGPSVEAALVNLSVGGMALLLNGVDVSARLSRGARLRVHFRLPGMPLSQCRGLVTHAVTDRKSGWLRLGVRFVAAPASLVQRIRRMEIDDEACDARAIETAQPRCDLACSFHSLCHKPFRDLSGSGRNQFEIALQHAST